MNMTEPLSFDNATQTRANGRGRLLLDESMAKHVTWRAGGLARQVYAPSDLADLQCFLATLPVTEPITFVGLGSNFLVRDGGYDGTIILMHRSDAKIRVDGDLVWADAGAASPKLARFSALQALEGGEFLAGVPGTIGGALAMNAGCYGAQTWEVVARVQTIDRHGVLRERMPSEFTLGYRHCSLSELNEPRGAVLGVNEWFTAGWFKFRSGDMQAARARITTWLARRVATQPLNLPNAGSVFRNPPNDYAARLIEASGLKGFAIGAARISERHANFIVNPGGAGSAAAIEALIAHARVTVAQRFGIDLIPEVRIIGTAA